MPALGPAELSRVVRQARSLPAAMRAAFLDEVSSGDEALRLRLESLLADESDSAETGQPVRADAALPADHRIGGYRLLGRLGRGGMGEVYLAEDTRLGRKVALKLLSQGLTSRSEPVGRFQREARAASALNHPGILTVHDFGEHDGRHFIAAEFVAGRTLRQVIGDGPAALPLALDVAIQIAHALAAAHEAGIVHRDVKPENVMLRPDGYVKVLDFGLAKLTAERAPSDGDEGPASEPSSFETRVGSRPGTARYMSPEQARGQPVDRRSDLFSLGVVLYELATGRHPFEGATVREVLANILERDPPPVARAGLEPILRRLLEKDPERRYQSARELVVDLKALNRTIEPTRKHPLRTLAPAAGLLGAAALVTALVVGSAPRRGPSAQARAPRFESMQISRLTSTGNVLAGTISPDGRLAAYVRYEPAGKSVWIEPLPTGSPRRLVPAEPAQYWSLAFAADGESLYYVAEAAEDPVDGALFEVPVAGGTPRRLITGVASVGVAPDGRRLLLKRWHRSSRVSALVLADADGGAPQTIAVGTTSRELLTFAWSPDGRSIAYAFSDRDAAGEYWGLVELPVDGGRETTIVAKRRRPIGGLAWLPDRSGLIVGVDDESLGVGQLCHVSYPDGATTRITRDLNSYGYPTLTSDGRTLLTIQQGRPARIWIAPRDDPDRARPAGAGAGEYGDLAWAPDGSLVYVLATNPERNLWVIDAAGGAPRQLTARARANWMPDVTPDGRHIVFQSNRSGKTSLWRIDADGGNPLQLSDVEGTAPQCSPDGRWVLFRRTVDGRSTLWKVPIEGGTATPWLDGEAYRAALSPDGRWLAAEYTDSSMMDTRVALRSIHGGEPIRTFDLGAGYGQIRFSPASDGLVYIGGGDSEILFQPLAGGPPQVWLHSPFETLFAVALSPDGKQIAYTSGLLTSDAVLFRNLR